jgi:HEPN domain-containing protein
LNRRIGTTSAGCSRNTPRASRRIAAAEIDRLAAVSTWLRKEREFAFYGDIDFIPTEQYTRDTAERAIADAEFVVAAAGRVIDAP